MRVWLIGAFVLCVVTTGVQAQVTALTPLTSYDAGENIVSYYRYVAVDCWSESACEHTSIVTTSGRVNHRHVAAVLTGFRLWSPNPDKIGKLAVRVNGTAAGGSGQVQLHVSGLLELASKQLFSYEATVAIIESTIEGFLLTKTGTACAVDHCPVSFTAAGAVPPGWVLVGLALSEFDSDREISPLWGALVMPIVHGVDPASGDVTATMHCGTVQQQGASPTQLSGPCETQWVVIAAHVGIANGSQPSGPPSFPVSPWTALPAAGINNPNPSSVAPGMLCAPHPMPSPGFLDALEGFLVFAGQFSGGAFAPGLGPASSLEMNALGLGYAAPGMPQVTYSAGLTVSQVLVPTLPPATVPLTYVRASTLVCL